MVIITESAKIFVYKEEQIYINNIKKQKITYSIQKDENDYWTNQWNYFSLKDIRTKGGVKKLILNYINKDMDLGDGEILCHKL